MAARVEIAFVQNIQNALSEKSLSTLQRTDFFNVLHWSITY